MTITKASVEAALNRHVVPKVDDLVPNGAKLVKMLKAQKLELDGREFLQPVSLSHEHGVTYGDDTSFVYNDAISAIYDEVKLESNPIVLQSRINLKAFNRLTTEMAIVRNLGFRFINIKRSLAKRLELSYWYGKSGLGQTVGGAGGKVAVAGVATQIDINISNRTFAPGIWSAMTKAAFDLHKPDTTKLNPAPMTVVQVDHDNRTVRFECGSEANRDAIAADGQLCDLYFAGSFDNDMLGIDKQISTKTGEVFGISKDIYELWRGHTYDCAGDVDMAKILKALTGPLNVGGLEEDVVCWVPHAVFADLNLDEAALREFDKSYKPEKSERGNQGIKFYFQGGSLEVKAHSYLKQGESFIIPKGCLKKVGSRDMEFIRNTDDQAKADQGSILKKLETVAAYQILYGVDHHIWVRDVAKCVKLINCVPA